MYAVQFKNNVITKWDYVSLVMQRHVVLHFLFIFFYFDLGVMLKIKVSDFIFAGVYCGNLIGVITLWKQ